MTEVRHVPHSAPLIGTEEIRAAERVLRSGYVAQGKEVEAFEAECAALVGRKHGIAANSGTAALHLALLAMNIDADSVVGMPSYVCTALLHATLQSGASAAVHDVDQNFNAVCPDMQSGDAAIVTHLFGKTGCIPPRVHAVEDIAQAIGGSAGRAGRVAVASFYATKLMTSGGEGGMLLTDEASLAANARDLRDYDNRNDFRQRFNYKMTELAAAIGREQLRKLPDWIMRRRELAGVFAAAFAALPLTLPDPEDHVFFRYVVLSDRREALQQHLNSRGVDAKRPVFRPLHRYELPAGRVVLNPAYPGADRAHQQAISIPLHPGMNDADITHVVNSVAAFF